MPMHQDPLLVNSLRPSICVSKLTITGSVNGLSRGRRRAIIWTSAGMLLIWPPRTNFIDFLLSKSFIHEMHLNMSSAEWWPFCLDLNMLILRRTMTARDRECTILWLYDPVFSVHMIHSPDLYHIWLWAAWDASRMSWWVIEWASDLLR